MPVLRPTPRFWMAAALILLPHLAPPARADASCIAAPSQDCAFAWARATARAEALGASFRVGAVIRVASGLAQAGRDAEARAEFAEALAHARALGPDAADPMIGLLAAEQVRVGMAAEGQALARSIANPKARQSAWHDIVKAMAERERLDDAAPLARAIEDSAVRAQALYRVAVGLAAAGRPDDALGMARTIEHIPERLRAFAEITVSLAQRDRGPEADALLGEALILARALGGARERAVALAVFAGVLGRLGRSGDAKDLARSIEEASLRDYGFELIASAEAKAGRIEPALATVKLIARRNSSSGQEAAGDIVVALVKAGRLEEALRLAKAMHWADVNGHLTRAFRAIVLAHAEAGRFPEASALLRSIDTPGTRDRVTLALLPLLTAAGRFDDALGQARLCYYAYEKVKALTEVGAALLKAGRKPAAAAAFGEALAAAGTLPEGFFRAEALAGAAIRMER